MRSICAVRRELTSFWSPDNRGVQTALIERRLHEAALAGCEYAVVSTQPTTGSQRNMKRRGLIRLSLAHPLNGADDGH